MPYEHLVGLFHIHIVILDLETSTTTLMKMEGIEMNGPTQYWRSKIFENEIVVFGEHR